MPFTHPYDYAQDGQSDLITEPARPRFEMDGASWPQGWWQNLLLETQTMLTDYRLATREGSPRIDQHRDKMKAQFLKNALKIAQTLERGYVETSDWQAFKEERLS